MTEEYRNSDLNRSSVIIKNGTLESNIDQGELSGKTDKYALKRYNLIVKSHMIMIIQIKYHL